MIYLLYIYFGINLMMLGSYLFDRFNDDNKLTKLFSSLVLFFFGGILVVYELTIADKVAEWWDNSELNFIWQVYILKQYDKLHSSQVEYLNEKLSAQKDKNSKLYKHLKLILKRNGR